MHQLKNPSRRLKTSYSPESRHSTLAIVLAGGSGSRLGELGSVLPKCMLAVSSRETLLTRLVSQLLEGGIRRVVVSTSPGQHPILKCFLERALISSRHSGTDNIQVSVFSNPAHALGPTAALAKTMRVHKSQKYLLALSDIVFTVNPFLKTETDGNCVENMLVLGPYKVGRNGIVLTSSAFVSSLMHDPITLSQELRECALNWTGVAWFGPAVSEKIIEFARNFPSQPLDEAFTFALSAGSFLGYVETGQFANINAFDDLVECQAMLQAQASIRVDLRTGTETRKRADQVGIVVDR